MRPDYESLPAPVRERREWHLRSDKTERRHPYACGPGGQPTRARRHGRMPLPMHWRGCREQKPHALPAWNARRCAMPWCAIRRRGRRFERSATPAASGSDRGTAGDAAGINPARPRSGARWHFKLDPRRYCRSDRGAVRPSLSRLKPEQDPAQARFLAPEDPTWPPKRGSQGPCGPA